MSKLALHGGKPVRTEPFPTWPRWDEREITAVTEVVRSGKWGSKAGTRVQAFERAFADYHGARHGVCVNSGTTALRVALQALGIGAGDEVIVPAYTFVATASAVLELGALPVFADIDLTTFNLDPNEIERLVTPRTRAVLPVHFGGRPVDLSAVVEICRKHDLQIVEDAAQAWGSEWQGRKVGTFGKAGGFSFQSSKNITAGEGGILLSDDDAVADLCRGIANCGRVQGRPWYEHHFLGGNYRMTELQAAVLLVQLERYEELKQIRERNARLLDQQLAEIEGIEPLTSDPNVTANSRHLYIFRYQKAEFGDAPKSRFLEALRAEGIPASPGYSLPLYQQPMFQKRAFGPLHRNAEALPDYARVALPNTERACHEEAVWLTQNVLLGSEQDMMDVVRAISKIRESGALT